MKPNALALIAAMLTAFPVFADGEGFLRFAFDRQTLDLAPEAIAKVSVIKDFNNQDALDVTVAPDWIAPLAHFTLDPQGRPISIFICGVLIAEPVLQGQIAKGRFFLTGDPQVIRKAALFLKAKSCAAVPNS